MTTAPYDTFVIDIPEDSDELVISHAVTISGVTVRVLAEPHQWNILKGATDPLTAIRAFVHPDDWPPLDNMLTRRKNLNDGTISKVLNALTEKPTGHPTAPSSVSPDS